MVRGRGRVGLEVESDKEGGLIKKMEQDKSLECRNLSGCSICALYKNISMPPKHIQTILLSYW